MTARKRKKRILGRIIVFALALAVCAGAIAVAVHMKLTGLLTPLPGDSGASAVDDNEINVLVLGTDFNPDTGESSSRTDLIVLARFNVVTKTITALQIPRDSYVGYKDAPSTGKINEVYEHYNKTPGQGIVKLSGLVESFTGIKPDYYMIMGLDTFMSVINDIGGVSIDIPSDFFQMKDFAVQTTIKYSSTGHYVLNGYQSMVFMRYREGYLMGDIGRLQTQQMFWRAFFAQIKTQSSVKLLSIVSTYHKDLNTNMSLGKALNYAKQAIGVDDANINIFTAPGNGVMAGGFAVYELDQDKLNQILADNFGVDTAQMVMLPAAKKDPSQPNGYGSQDEADISDDTSDSSSSYGYSYNDGSSSSGGYYGSSSSYGYGSSSTDDYDTDN